MSCICQYFVYSQDGLEVEDPKNIHKDVTTTETIDPRSDASARSEISATELATARAENWLLSKQLSEAHITIENLEGFVKTILDKQNAMLTELYHIKNLNQTLEEECRLQHDYHTTERNAMMKELQDVKEILEDHSKLLEETFQKNKELMSDVQDANEKIYSMGMKYVRLKNERSYHSSEETNLSPSDEDISG